MKKLLVLLIPSILAITSTLAQTWSPLGSGVNNPVNALTVYNSNLYAGGYFSVAGGIPANYIAEWNGTSWSALGKGINGVNVYNPVNALTVYNGNLYAGGSFDTAGGNPAKNIAKWNGTSWSPLGSGINGTVYALAVYNGNLYAGGMFDTAGGIPAIDIAEWNGTSWSALGTGLVDWTSLGIVSALTLYNGDLCVAGYFNEAGGNSASNIALWNGTSWSALGTGVGGLSCQVLCLDVYNGNLYLGGYFTTAGGVTVNDIAEWNGTSYDSLGSGVSVGWGVAALITCNGNLCAGGRFDSAGGQPANYVADWNGTSWTTLDTGAGSAFALAIYNGKLYEGGGNSNGGNNFIMEWNGVTGIKEISNNASASIFPNPNNGKFTVGLSNVNEKTEIEIYTVLGEKIYAGNLNYYNTDIDLSNIPSGVYLYKILTETGNIAMEGKFVIQK